MAGKVVTIVFLEDWPESRNFGFRHKLKAGLKEDEGWGLFMNRNTVVVMEARKTVKIYITSLRRSVKKFL